MYTIYNILGDFVNCIFTILLQIQHENNSLPSLRSRRLYVVDARKNGRTTGRQAFFVPITSKRLLHRSTQAILYLTANIDKPKLVAFLIFVCGLLHLSLIFGLSKMSRYETLVGFGRKTLNNQGYSELREPIKTRENCYSPIW